MKKVRILIADDHDVVRRGLRVLIESEWGWEVCGEATTGRQAVDLTLELVPDVVVIDVGMPELSGTEATRKIKEALPETRILIFTGFESEALVHQVLSAGARACVLKSEAGDQLLPAIKSLLRGEPYLGSRVAKVVFESYLKGGVTSEDTSPDGLTPRDREIIQMLSEGASNKEVAHNLGVTVKTAESQRAAIMKKLGFSAFSELVRYAVRNHIVAP